MAKIVVTEGWRGLGSGGQWIEAKTYEDHNDPALFGQADYLVKAGRAEWLDTPSDEPKAPEPVVIDYPDFMDMTLDDIDAWMTDNDIETPVGWSNMTKPKRVIWLEGELGGLNA